MSASSASLDVPFNSAHFEALPSAACVTLYHRSGRAGCGTFSRATMTGRLLDWTSVTSSNNADEASPSTTVPPYVAVIDEKDYTLENVARLQSYASEYLAGDEFGPVDEGGPLRGVLVLAGGSSSGNSSESDNNSRSPEPMTPSGYGTPMSSLTIGSSYAWNVYGDGLAMANMYGLPTVLVTDTDTSSYLRGVATDQSNSIAVSTGESAAQGLNAAVYPSIVSEFNFYMGPGGETTEDGNEVYNSQKCLEWKDTDGKSSPKCAPLGGNSVWATAGTPLSAGYQEGDDKPTILVATSIDSTSMFHTVSPGASNAASNILTLLMAAKLIGSVKDETLDGLNSRITFGFFQGESFAGNEGVPSVYKRKDEGIARACLHPLRADLTFQNLGAVQGMIAVDQVANLGNSKNMYVHSGESTDGGAGLAGFLSEVLIELSADGDYSAQAASVGNQDDGTTPIPPTPLSSLVQLSSSSTGGVVLTGFDDAFMADSRYHSHLDSASKGQTIDKDAIASAATLVARSAIAGAYQNGDNEIDAETASAYALEALPDAVSSSSGAFSSLYDCLFVDGNCQTFVNAGSVEANNDGVRTGTNLGLGLPLETPPSYYTSIYYSESGQAFVKASGRYYGSMIEGEEDPDGEVVKNYGDDASDAVLVRPSLLEMSIFGLLNNYLGQGAVTASEDGTSPTLASCSSVNDCASVSYCSATSLSATCASGQCVCGSRSHYHLALDEALSATANDIVGMFSVDENEQHSAMYTEPYWSSSVGCRLYNDAGKDPGIWTASVGFLFSLGCALFVRRLKAEMVKEKVY
ncbi:hypothetical protein THAOC_00937 [Thalassiosira oceanica]|uniref:Nicastrin n=1 Tax=Thalassiosira oceanica TaxID=159749 RepID=K0TI67_THAOC|nr:hypothetical protein THAOC_00937 [Thalassiosira oceanica]|eukprot:EJK77240.1 hypothetical protein THAOC_00937 [Thalassiosira oceanica]